MALQTKDFSVTQKSSGGGITYTYTLRVTENSTNVEKNISNITVQAILKQSYSGTAFKQWTTYYTCSINGAQKFSESEQKTLTGTDELVLHTWTGDIEHGADGSLSITVGGKLWQNAPASYSPPTMTIKERSNDTLELTDIPRASTVSATDASIESVSTIVVDRKSSNFTHVLSYSFGTLSGYIGSDGKHTESPVKLTSTVVNFTLPESFYSQIPNDPDGWGQFYCTTYNGDIQIGDTQPCKFKAKADESMCAPFISGVIEDCNPRTQPLTGDSRYFVRGFSDVLCTITNLYAQKSAAITSVSVGGLSVELDTDKVTLEGVTSNFVEFTVTDSRGYVGRHIEPIDFMIPYVPLTCNASVKRQSPTSEDAEIIVSGQCWCGNFGTTENYLSIGYKLDGKYELIEDIVINEDSSYSFAIPIYNLDYTKSYQLEVTVDDALDSVLQTLTVNKGIPVFDWGENDFAFNVPVKFNAGIGGGNKAGLAAYPVGSIYMSVIETSPADIFGGEWERLQDRFLLAAGDTYNGGSTGGEASHTLKTSEMPSHSHNVNALVYGYDYWKERTTDAFTVAHVYGTDEYLEKGVTKKMADVFGGGTYEVGGSEPHNNMPPYLAVYMWKRTE